MMRFSAFRNAVLVTAFVVSSWSPALSQSATEAQILEALAPKPEGGITRSLSLGSPPRDAQQDDVDFIDSVRPPRTRSLSRVERDKLADVSAGKPTIDLEIPFDFNSSKISRKALPVVANLGAALSRPGLKDRTFVIAGHTDAKGGDATNQRLSERRAEAVRQHLVKRYKVAPQNLISVGYGKSRPKTAANPTGHENRRVQVTNVAEAKSAGR